MQLLYLNLGGNQLEGSLPEAWSHLSKVSYVSWANLMVALHATAVLVDLICHVCSLGGAKKVFRAESATISTCMWDCFALWNHLMMRCYKDKVQHMHSLTSQLLTWLRTRKLKLDVVTLVLSGIMAKQLTVKALVDIRCLLDLYTKYPLPGVIHEHFALSKPFSLSTREKRWAAGGWFCWVSRVSNVKWRWSAVVTALLLLQLEFLSMEGDTFFWDSAKFLELLPSKSFSLI